MVKRFIRLTAVIVSINSASPLTAPCNQPKCLIQSLFSFPSFYYPKILKDASPIKQIKVLYKGHNLNIAAQVYISKDLPLGVKKRIFQNYFYPKSLPLLNKLASKSKSLLVPALTPDPPSFARLSCVDLRLVSTVSIFGPNDSKTPIQPRLLPAQIGIQVSIDIEMIFGHFLGVSLNPQQVGCEKFWMRKRLKAS